VRFLLLEGSLADTGVGKALDDVVVVRGLDTLLAAETAKVLSAHFLVQVLLRGMTAHDLAGARDLEALGSSLWVRKK